MFRFLGVLIVSAVLLVGCTTDDERAAAVAAELAQDIADRYDSPGGYPRDAEYVASEIVFADETSRVEMLDWEGETDGDDGARLDVRIVVSLPESKVGGGFTSRTLPASEAVRCWSITVSSRIHALRTIREISCPDSAIARIPDPEPLAELPDDVEAVLAGALEGATRRDAVSRVEQLFPGDGYRIVAEERGDVLVVALGAPAVRDCAVAVVADDKAVSVVTGFSRDLLLPGEMGCSPGLIPR